MDSSKKNKTFKQKSKANENIKRDNFIENILKSSYTKKIKIIKCSLLINCQ